MNTDKLKKLNPCQKAVDWLAKQKSYAQAWRDCQRGDWMLWLVGKLSGKPQSRKRQRLVLCACECARLALQYVPKDEKRPLKAIETAEAWARGDKGVTLTDICTAAYDAYAAVYAAAYAAASYVAYASAYASAYAASAASADDAAADAAHTADAAACAADAAHAAAKSKALAQCADIVRKHYPQCPKF